MNYFETHSNHCHVHRANCRHTIIHQDIILTPLLTVTYIANITTIVTTMNLCFSNTYFIFNNK